uniref:SH3 domain-containing protein n=1 Tax=Globodera rostochiensis TaxID=31243 RepID=A0A914HNQ9_GLORO
MSSPTGQGTREKGNVARIVDRLSKQDFNTLTRAESAPLKANRCGGGISSVGAVGGGGVCGNGGVVGLSVVENALEIDGGGDVIAEVNDAPNGHKPKECAVEGDELTVLELVEDGWARGCILHSASSPHSKGRSGLYPTNFVSTISPTPTTQTTPATANASVPSLSKIEGLLSSGGVPISTSTSIMSNGSGVVQVNNVLPSSLLKGGGASTVAAGARRAMSTLIAPTSAVTVLESGDASNAHKSKEFAKVLYNYEAANPDEISLLEGTIVTVVSRNCEEEDWFVAEHEGRRGLFPDNFVRFLDHGHMQVSPNALPPSLPAKPSKFCGVGGNPPAVPPISSRNSVNALFKSSTDSSKATTTDVQQSMAVDRMSQPVVPKPMLNNGAALDASKSNVFSTNRRSVIEGLQKQLFPSGKLPPQRPPQPNLPGTRSLGAGVEPTLEPKLIKDGETPAKLLISSSSIVKSRTNIAPSNKRPPSKVNSAATLADAVNDSTAYQPQNAPSLVFVVKEPTQAHEQIHSSPEDLTTTTAGSPPPVSSCLLAMNKTTVFSTRPPSPVLQPTPILCAVVDEQQLSQHPQLTLFSPTTGVNKQFQAQQSPHLPSSPSIDHSNYVSRAEFDRYKEEQEHKLAALHADLEGLRPLIGRSSGYCLLFSGKLRLQKWYVAYADENKKQIARELITTILARKPKMCAFLEYKDMKIAYKRYASLYFCSAIEQSDNELLCLEIIHRYVELLDRYFGSVCELDITFNFEKAYFILDEFLLAGEIQETSMRQILKAISAQDLLRDNETTQGLFEVNGFG